MPRPERSPKFSTIRSAPVIRETRRSTFLLFQTGDKVPWVVEDWVDDYAMVPLVLSLLANPSSEAYHSKPI